VTLLYLRWSVSEECNLAWTVACRTIQYPLARVQRIDIPAREVRFDEWLLDDIVVREKWNRGERVRLGGGTWVALLVTVREAEEEVKALLAVAWETVLVRVVAEVPFSDEGGLYEGARAKRVSVKSHVHVDE